MNTQARLAPVATPTPWHVRGVDDVAEHLHSILAQAHRLKAAGARGRLPPLLKGRAVVLLFARPSTRTRISFDLGLQRLGAAVSVMDEDASQMDRGESPTDTALVLARYADAIVYRAASDEAFDALAAASPVPVVNALTPSEHPCQVLADLMALQEEWGELAGRSVAWVGDGNNVCRSWLLAAPRMGMDIHVATPAGFAPHPGFVEQAQALARAAGTQLRLTTDPEAAVAGADVVITDTWVSMGDGSQRAERIAAFDGFTVDAPRMAAAAPEAVFLHCLPGHWGQEATADVAYGPQSRVLRAAEDRMWVQMALLAHLVGASSPLPPAA